MAKNKTWSSWKNSLQLRLTLGYALLIAVLLLLMNTYPLLDRKSVV